VTCITLPYFNSKEKIIGGGGENTPPPQKKKKVKKKKPKGEKGEKEQFLEGENF